MGVRILVQYPSQSKATKAKEGIMSTSQNSNTTQLINYDNYIASSFFEIRDASGNVVDYGDLVEAFEMNEMSQMFEADSQD